MYICIILYYIILCQFSHYFATSQTGLILESKDMRVIFQEKGKKRAKKG